MSHIPGSASTLQLRWPSVLLAALLALCYSTPAMAADKTAADYYIHSLPGAPSPLLNMYAGHIEITPEHHGNLFFWFFKNRHIANRRRTVIWLNGGPGCSSMDGAMMEIGPYRVDKDGNLSLNDGSWDEFANVLFIDNPVGTGFSYVDTDSYIHELTTMSSQMLSFLEKFFEIFPENAHDDIYIAGESYAGQHIPYIASAILDRNALNAQQWNLSGLLIGNGWISGVDQYPAYVTYAKQAGLVKDGSEASDQLDRQLRTCTQDLSNGGKDHVDVNSCEAILQEILRLSTKTNKDSQCVNMYDVRLSDSYPSCGMNWPPDLPAVTDYLRRDDVKAALHINSDKKTGWTECNGNVGNAFNARKSKPSYKLLPDILSKVPIVLFSGDKDLICNHLGTESLINNLEWNGAKGMELTPGTWAPRQDWSFEGEPAGIYQEARNLTYVKFYNSSHMVPFDYPRRTRDMLDRFMGVDIASIGGSPANSQLDGEKAPSTSVGGHPNSTAAQEAEADKLQQATWQAYRRSGEVALFFVVIAALAWGFFVWRDRRRRAGYRGVFGSDPYDGRNGDPGMASGLGLDGFSDRRKSRRDRDVEAARDYDEAELDDLSGDRRAKEDAFDLANSEDEDETHGRAGGANGHA